MKNELYGIKLTLTGMAFMVLDILVVLGLSSGGFLISGIIGVIVMLYGIYQMWKKPIDEGTKTVVDEVKQLAEDLKETVKLTQSQKDIPPAEDGEKK